MSVEYTTREEHPRPAILMHWVHLVALAVLIWTGFFIRRPFYAGSMQLNRSLHLIFMWVLIFTAVVRVYYAFVGFSAAPGMRRRIRDYRHFGRQEENRGKFFEQIKYYLFLRRTSPRHGKYNTLQKGTYVFWLLLIAIQAITGLAIWTTTQRAFAPLTYALGGPAAIRTYHYWIMWIFIVTVAVHIYLSAVEAWRELPLMFFGIETGKPTEEESRPATMG